MIVRDLHHRTLEQDGSIYNDGDSILPHAPFHALKLEPESSEGRCLRTQN